MPALFLDVGKNITTMYKMFDGNVRIFSLRKAGWERAEFAKGTDYLGVEPHIISVKHWLPKIR